MYVCLIVPSLIRPSSLFTSYFSDNPYTFSHVILRPYLTTLLVSLLCHTGFVQSNFDRRDSPVVKPASGHALDLSSIVGDTKATRLLHGRRALDVTKNDPEHAVSDSDSASSPNLRTQEPSRPLLEELHAASDRLKSEEDRIKGEHFFVTYDLCGFSCATYGYCPESICEYDVLSVDLSRLCNFTCRYGYCPPQVCQIVIPKDEEDGKTKREEDETNHRAPGVVTVPPTFGEDSVKNREKNDKQCLIYKDGYQDPEQLTGCKKACQNTLDKAKEENRTSNYGCILWSPESEGGLKSIPWQRQPSTGRLVTGGKCSCDNWLANDLVDYFIEALPAIAQIGCFILISALKLVIDVGLSIFGGKTLTAGVDMALTAVELTNYVYSKEEDPLGALEWWLSPCGGSHLVPAEIKQAFDILSFAPGDKSSYKEPTKIKKHSGKKGDEGNPRSEPGKSTSVGPIKSESSNTRTKKCSIKLEDQTKTVGVALNTLELRSCNGKDETVTEHSVLSTMTHEPLATRPKVKVNCSAVWNQSCHNYSAVIRESSRWSTFTLPSAVATWVG
ncbi:uncharacterized protein NECHADRAFT_78500 [Fusarium vanettenii 77-13-4]|uniref:Uncharacterized protein n=1 Tax=Fusarium vanettenii (strain ATCC MYA-4622 / CBS 123669 / FGSC 9596 / NRRL 45880 / 77-13-4) TaxID=660122 RepID=C7ZLW4_FUSV7|nr:uncharacterized protein NECHADRAFT_78500 [Fusarium vanettenii 77-13-4]EEU34967.1 hypothetical protein NECHADRAFT_78500 [Fusarium vanettenii 77-13-4]